MLKCLVVVSDRSPKNPQAEMILDYENSRRMLSQVSTWIIIFSFVFDLDAKCCYKQECPPHTDFSIVVYISVHDQMIKCGDGATSHKKT